MAMKEHMPYKADTTTTTTTTTTPRLLDDDDDSSTTTTTPRRLLDDDDDDDDDDEEEEEEEEEEVPLFTIHSFIHIQATVEVEGVEEQMLIFSSSLNPGRVKGSRIALI